MTDDERPVVYIIDDDPTEQATAAALTNLGLDAEYLYPTAVRPEHLERATLLAVDEFFDLTAQPEADDVMPLPTNLALVAKPVDGLALSAVLRSAGKQLRGTEQRPIGICLRSGDLPALSPGLPAAMREPLLAAQHDLEWVMSKSGRGSTDPLQAVVGLARALQSYPTRWPAGSVRPTGHAWLAVPDAPWSDEARRQIDQCRPPVEDALSAHGLAWFRWLAQRILPFPTFLISASRIALILGVTPDSLATVTADETSELAQQLSAIRYRGPLAELHPARHWRAGVYDVAARYTDDPDDPILVGEAVAAVDSRLEPLEMDSPVLCIDDDYSETGVVLERADAVRIVPDGWPAYADPAWADPQDVDDGAMADMLAPRLR